MSSIGAGSLLKYVKAVARTVTQNSEERRSKRYVQQSNGSLVAKRGAVDPWHRFPAVSALAKPSVVDHCLAGRALYIHEGESVSCTNCDETIPTSQLKKSEWTEAQLVFGVLGVDFCIGKRYQCKCGKN